MRKLSEFPAVSRGWIKSVASISSSAVKDGIEAGAMAMREGIQNSPTETKWHRDKNDANPGFGSGARIGNRNPTFGEVDPKSGLMLASVSSAGPINSSGGKKVSGSFGWIDTKESYFLLQDVGNYSVGNQKGMGLLNLAMNSTESVNQMGAYVEASQATINSMVTAGFKVSGGEF